MSNHKLAARVLAVNNANRYAKEMYPKLVAALRPFVGKQIEKAVGGLMKKVQDALPEFVHTVPMSVYRYASNYSLVWVMKACESVPPNGCMYHETSLYVGHLSNGVLTEFYDAPVLRTDWTVEEVERLRTDYKAAQALADKAKSALGPFGEYDR